MLTDYHVHLRSDALEASAAEHFTAANAERYRQAAEERGIAELGVSEHIYRFRQALDIWQHPFWRENATDDFVSYCEFVREDTDLRLGVEADFLAGHEDRIANMLEAHELDYVIGSVHFISLAGAANPVRSGAVASAPAGRAGTAERPQGFAAVDMEEYGIWRAGLSAEALWRRYFETLGEAAASGLFDVLAHPDLVKVFGGSQPRPEGDLRRFYELAIDGIASSGVAVELSTAGLRKRAGELYPAAEFLEMCLEAGAPVALSSDAHRPEDIGADYDQALALLERLGVSELCVFEGRQRRLVPIAAR